MLFIKELKKTVCSLVFLVLVIAIFVFANSQDVLDFSQEPITCPEPGGAYGTHTKEVPEVIMPAAFERLLVEYRVNGYSAYPIGFYKKVRLSEGKKAEMASVLAALTGIEASVIREMSGDALYGLTLREDITYEEFLEQAEKADQLIGGGSSYCRTYLKNFGRVPVTYEEAAAQYELCKSKDRFTGAYARYFCDYMGIMLSVLPVFSAVSLCLKDTRAGISSLVYSRRVSSLKLILARYLAVCLAVVLPVLVLAYVSNMSIWRYYEGMALDYLAPLKYTLGWLLPSVMISVAVGMFFTVLTGTPIAIAIQGLWWFIDVNTGIAGIDGAYGLFRLSPRHNTLRNTQGFLDGLRNLASNRLLMAGSAMLLVLAAAAVYEQKRRGNLGGSKRTKRLFTAGTDCDSESAA